MAGEPTRKLFRSTRRRVPEASARLSVFRVERADSDTSTSRQVALSDDFIALAQSAGATIVLPTPYNVPRLFQIIEQSNMVQQCIDAYATNTVLAGWEVAPAYRGKVPNQGEQVELESFIEHPNVDQSLTGVMDSVIRDREGVGFGFLEVIRDASGALSLLRWCPALYTRLCVKHPKHVLVEYTIPRGRRVSMVKEYKRFRRFIQIVNGEQVWFKEFGDTRQMDYTNGAFEGEPGFNPAHPATEIYHFKRPSNEPYGVPQWINQLPSIVGSREAEEVNLRYFQDNTVPPLMLMVGNGRLTQQSYRELTRALNEEDIGKSRQNRIMLIEAVGEGDSLDGKSSPIDLKVERLSDVRQSDGLFKMYDDANMAKVRSSFRLPPITVGMSQDVNFATASTSAFVAESQVFAPARNQIDEQLNHMIVNGHRGLQLTTVKLVSRTPSITSPEMVIKTMTALNVMGALTPRIAQMLANALLQMEIPEYPKKGHEDYEEWMDHPLILAAKQGAGADGGTTTHDLQNAKDDRQKAVEAEGDVGQDVPKNGQQ